MRNNIFLLSVLILTSCGTRQNEDLDTLLKKESELQKQLSEIQQKIKTLRKDTITPMLVSVERLVPQTFRSYLSFQGKVDADENISISSEVPGIITRIYVKVGDIVKAGQVLAETDSRSIQQSIQALKSNLDFVNEMYEKQKKLWEQKIGTEVQYLQIKAQKENLEKTLASLEEQLRMTKIISPIDGTVDAVDIKLGQMAAPGIPSVRIINFNSLKVKADIPENYISQVHQGDSVKIFLPDTQDSILGKLTYVSRTINNITRTFNVEVYIGKSVKLYPNQIAVLKINNYTSSKPVIVVPVNYIQTDTDGNKFVYIAEKNKVKKVQIQVGRISDDKAEIISGLNENDLLIKTTSNLRVNMPVIIQNHSVL